LFLGQKADNSSDCSLGAHSWRLSVVGVPNPIILSIWLRAPDFDASLDPDSGLQRTDGGREELGSRIVRAFAGKYGPRAGDRGRLFHRRNLRYPGSAGCPRAAHPAISAIRE